MQWIPSEKKEQPEQESKLKIFVWFKTDNGWRKKEFKKTLVKKVPLDTTPPQRTWVGLTDEEKHQLNNALNLQGRFPIIDAIEAKLRGKNGG